MSNRSRKKLDVGITDAGPAWWASGVEPGCERPPWWQTSLDDELEFFALSVELAVVCGRLMKVGDDVILSHLLEVAELDAHRPGPPEDPWPYTEGLSGDEDYVRLPFHPIFRHCLDAVCFSRRDDYARERVVSLAVPGSSWRPWPGR